MPVVEDKGLAGEARDGATVALTRSSRRRSRAPHRPVEVSEDGGGAGEAENGEVETATAIEDVKAPAAKLARVEY
ncbi:hypothetical protein E2562_010595 [Oryza meyeriana var. granulata]|uniref:Uncharacterized protein n=1 Tax=Oryza meyeriana var. granulata TaxID=110450 RepID=A0A6G1BUD6_9ORYZ|nr:hypothetical protein E2562_010595 [Oryza meyeriana var. granulata]